VPEHHVEHEQRAVTEGEHEPERLSGDAQVGEPGHAGDGELERRHATPSTSRWANSSTANAGPR
jgi:hypothetical protein